MTTKSIESDETHGHEAERARSQVLDLIEQARASGEAIPSERQLSTTFGVSRLTVRAALDELVREGSSSAVTEAGRWWSEPRRSRRS